MNFILRTRIKNHNFNNRIIGNSYVVTYNANKTKEEWEKEVKGYYPKIKSVNNIKAILLCDKAHIIDENMHAWIMTDTGKTFERIG